MLSAILDTIAKFQRKHPFIVVLLTVLFTLFMLFYALRLETDSSFDRMYSDDTNMIILKDLMRNEFGSTDTLYVLIEIDEDSNELSRIVDITDPRVIEYAKELSESLREETSVDSVFSVADVFMAQFGRLPQSAEESKSMIANLTMDSNQIVNSDLSAIILVAEINVGQKPGSLEKIEDALNTRIEESAKPVGILVTLTGLPTLINRIMILLINDNIRTIGIALLGVFLILCIYFRSVKIASVSVIPVLLTLTWLAGTLSLLNVRVTMMIASVGAMMVGMGIDYSLHMTHEFHHQIKSGASKVTRKTVVSVGGALLASVLTTLGGFLAMLLGETPNSQTQGMVLGIGIAYAIVSALLVLPALLVIQRRFLYSKLDEIIFKIKTRKDHKPSALNRILTRLAHIQVTRPYLVIGIIVGFTILMLPGFGFVYVDTDNENWIPDGDPVIMALDKVTFNFGGIDSQNFLVMINPQHHLDSDKEQPISDLRDPRVLRPLSQIDQEFLALEFVDSTSSASLDITSMHQGKVPHDIEIIKETIETNPRLLSYFNEDFSIMRFSPRGSEFTEENYFEMLAIIDSTSFPEEIVIVPQGGTADDIELMQQLSADTGKTTMLGFLFVIILASLFYLSFVVGMLAFIPIIFAIMWTIGIMGYIDLPFTVLTTGMLAILMGMGIDFSIHLIHRTRESIEAHKDLAKAITHALTSTGEAIAVTTLTTIVGFLALVMASLLGTQRLGYTLAVGVFCTFLSCMLTVPAVLSIKYRRYKK